MINQFWIGFFAGAASIAALIFFGGTFLLWWISGDEIDENKKDNQLALDKGEFVKT